MNEKRILAFIIDFLTASIVQAVLMTVLLIVPLTNGTSSIDEMFMHTILITSISVFYLVLRDLLPGGSIGKHITKTRVVTEDGRKASFVKRFLRNIPWILGPVEIFVYLATRKRLGDRLAKTMVVDLSRNS
ncbi:MAG TPA: RDD family protein [Treponema sp.]|jgi:uncharacterized RDD family membrane protein YckC|nr:RDD family protein [Treponema sp.]HBB42315.1 RDD family protein [Treponema sp.]